MLGLIWQIIRIGLFNQITLEHCPGLTALLGEGEKIDDLLKLSPEAILLRWVNHHLERAGTHRRVNNFQSDIVDSEVYTILLKQIAPQDTNVHTEAMYERDLLNRAEIMLQQAAKLKCRAFVTPQDVVNGVYKLNLAFVANLFNNHPALELDRNMDGYETIEETREERSKYELAHVADYFYILDLIYYNVRNLSEIIESIGTPIDCNIEWLSKACHHA